MRVKCLAQEHHTMTPARARTRTARSGVERLTMRQPRLPHKFLVTNQNPVFHWLCKCTSPDINYDHLFCSLKTGRFMSLNTCIQDTYGWQGSFSWFSYTFRLSYLNIDQKRCITSLQKWGFFTQNVNSPQHCRVFHVHTGLVLAGVGWLWPRLQPVAGTQVCCEQIPHRQLSDWHSHLQPVMMNTQKFKRRSILNNLM